MNRTRTVAVVLTACCAIMIATLSLAQHRIQPGPRYLADGNGPLAVPRLASWSVSDGTPQPPPLPPPPHIADGTPQPPPPPVPHEFDSSAGERLRDCLTLEV
jgi:hypothetical protein